MIIIKIKMRMKDIADTATVASIPSPESEVVSTRKECVQMKGMHIAILCYYCKRLSVVFTLACCVTSVSYYIYQLCMPSIILAQESQRHNHTRTPLTFANNWFRLFPPLFTDLHSLLQEHLYLYEIILWEL